MSVVNFVKLKSYGFLHPGRERWKQVLKRSWHFIPGSALYGAVSHALILADFNGDLDAEEPQHNWGSYYHLLQRVKERQIRFSPLLMSKEPVKDLATYNKVGYELVQRETQPAFGTTPHAPINRQNWSIHEDQLYGVVAHQPFQEYYGFIVCRDANFTPTLKKALRMFPIMPFSGRGKYTTVEAEIIKTKTLDALAEGLELSNTVWAVTPIIFPNGNPTAFLSGAEMYDLSLRRYRVWRTGLYYEDDKWKRYRGEEEKQRLTAGAFGLEDGTKLIFSRPVPFDDFVWGVGHQEDKSKDWTYLGWGQIVFAQGDDDGEIH